MSYLNIKLKKKLKFRLDLNQLIPDKIVKKTKTEIKTLQISYGNETRNISYFFSISYFYFNFPLIITLSITLWPKL